MGGGIKQTPEYEANQGHLCVTEGSVRHRNLENGLPLLARSQEEFQL